MDDLITRVFCHQIPLPRPDGSFIPGASNKYIINSDHVPVWIEAHGNYQWGDKNSHLRRHIKTVGKEKDRFTVQLTISKPGDKASVTYCIF